jgi:hypothetical protein
MEIKNKLKSLALAGLTAGIVCCATNESDDNTQTPSTPANTERERNDLLREACDNLNIRYNCQGFQTKSQSECNEMYGMYNNEQLKNLKENLKAVSENMCQK